MYRIVNDTTFIGVAEEKRRASEEFDQRQQAGENVGLVESRLVSGVGRHFVILYVAVLIFVSSQKLCFLLFCYVGSFTRC